MHSSGCLVLGHSIIGLINFLLAPIITIVDFFILAFLFFGGLEIRVRPIMSSGLLVVLTL